jgi:HK97 family phage prohead protease
MSTFELRDQGDGTLHFQGYASTFEVPYDMGSYTEVVKRGAFRRTLSEDPDTVLLINHTGLPLARTKSRTMQLSEDDSGLLVNADLDGRDPEVQSVARKYERGDLSGEMSFAFKVTSQSWNDDYSQRTIRSVSLHKGDVSIVVAGANPDTSSTFRGGEFTLEERHRRADAIGDRLFGGGGHILTLGDAPAPVAQRARVADYTTAARRDFEALLKRDGLTFEQWQRARGRGSSDFLRQARADLDRALEQARRR